MTAPYLLNINNESDFPNVELALREPDGLLAVGGDLSVNRLVKAYQNGIFPWYSEGQPILWWSPDPRMAKTVRSKKFTITFDQDFINVILACSKPRLEKGKVQDETWILEDMIDAYVELHNQGYAHSVECWHDEKLVGGLYGVAIGKVFFGESMFSKISDASKTAFVYLNKQLEQWGFKLVDCQVYTSHLESLGAKMIPRKEFIKLLEQYAIVQKNHTSLAPWSISPDLSTNIIESLSVKK